MLKAVTPLRASPKDRRFLASGWANSETSWKSGFLMTAEAGMTVNISLSGIRCQVGYAHSEPSLSLYNFPPVHLAAVGLCSSAESVRSASLRLACFLFAILRRRVGFERVEKASRDGRYFINRGQERSFIRFRRFVEAGDLPDELQRGGSNLLGVDRRIEVEKDFDIPAHA